MVVIRLALAGAKKRPFYRIVAADKRMPRDGRFIEKIGYFNPIASENETRISINHERIEYWISKGAQPSKRVKSLLKEDKLAAEAAARGETFTRKKAKKAQTTAATAHVTETSDETASAPEAPKAETAKEAAKIEDENKSEEPAEISVSSTKKEAAAEQPAAKEEEKAGANSDEESKA